MRFGAEKREFLVTILGETRVRHLEENLLVLAKELEERSVSFKDLRALYAPFMSHPDVEPARALSDFLGITTSVVKNPRLTLDQKMDRLRHAKGDLIWRVERAGSLKEILNPARRLVLDLMTKRPAESKAAKALRETGQPGADYAADVLEGRVVRG